MILQDSFGMRLRSIFYSLPVMLCMAEIASTAPTPATDAAKLLAKSQVIDAKCAVLAKDQSQTLRGFVAQAEISLAEKASVSVARKALAEGRAAGKAAVCDEAAKKLVNDVLAAAATATAAPIDDTTLQPAPAPVAVPEKPVKQPVALAVESPTPKKQAVVAKPQKPKAKIAKAAPTKPAKTAKTTKPVKGLSTYASVAEKYFVAVRCGSMSRSRINSLYQTVLINHRQALASNRHRDVRSMLKAAEARAGTKSCV
jgi:hypothetical protein